MMERYSHQLWLILFAAVFLIAVAGIWMSYK
jgi:cell division protein FtsL